LNRAVTAARIQAGVGARVRVNRVAIIAFLLIIDLAITAAL
jgi:hypothetical protein